MTGLSLAAVAVLVALALIAGAYAYGRRKGHAAATRARALADLQGYHTARERIDNVEIHSDNPAAAVDRLRQRSPDTR